MHFEFCIFSYNRGHYLKNCVESLRRCLPTQSVKTSITIYDDGSNDHETVSLLASIGETVHIRHRQDNSRLGGLWTNMQTAFDQSHADFIVFLQDDTQVIRPLDADDFNYIKACFSKYPKMGFLYPLFLRAQNRRNINRKLQINTEFPGYIMGKGTRNLAIGVYYNDVFIAQVSRLKDAHWHFAQSEGGNAIKAKSLFSPMMNMAHPFAMYVPETPIYRGGKPRFFDSLATKFFGDSVKAFRTMAPQHITRMKNRPLTVYPYAEDMLETISPSVRKPYVYRIVDRNKLIKKLHKIEMSLRGL